MLTCSLLGGWLGLAPPFIHAPCKALWKFATRTAGRGESGHPSVFGGCLRYSERDWDIDSLIVIVGKARSNVNIGIFLNPSFKDAF